MAKEDNETGSSKLANNVTLTVLSRIASIAAMAALPVVGAVGVWMMQRGVGAVDAVSAKVDTVNERILEAGSNVKLIQQTLEIQQRMLADHELRVRQLEQANRFGRGG